MDYQIWRDIYLALEQNLLLLHALATDAANAQKVTPGPLRFIWADAVANALYERREIGSKAKAHSGK